MGDYGRFDAFMSKNSQLSVTMDVYTFKNGLCQLSETGKIMEAGALQGDDYCQMFLNVDMGECNGCPDYTRRIEVYSNKDTGCELEFYREPINEGGDDGDNTDDGDNSNSGGDDSDNNGGNSDNGGNPGGEQTGSDPVPPL